ncbi:MerR family transcriptional regulator [Paenibacillus sp. NPDC058174]|uniref:MerR family transcriptional regulator n=1 Tax=Paenibacillus sp. NPDC058174 TaxID=3346366 RepID=UPI0036DE98EE
MSKRYYTAGAFAKLTSTTKRTLHFYDHKGLLKPSYNEQGYRTYTDEDLLRLQQILALKYLDYSLDEIKEYLEGEGSDFKASLERQHELLLQKQQHIQHVVATIERVSAIVKENHTLDPELIMMTIHSIQHEGEVKQRFSERLPDALVQSMFKRGASMEPEIMIKFNDLLLMSKQGLHPEDPLVQECARSLKRLIDQLLGQPLEELGMSETGKTLIAMESPSHIQAELINYLFEALRHLILIEGEGR